TRADESVQRDYPEADGTDGLVIAANLSSSYQGGGFWWNELSLAKYRVGQVAEKSGRRAAALQIATSQ
ncbi:MAG TPA: hypothetical protein VII25_14160, partial [Candidatus Acidoferrum sp.]